MVKRAVLERWNSWRSKWMDTIFLFRNTLAKSEMLIHYIAILSPTLWKLAWRTAVAEIARLNEEAAKKWGRANELIAFFSCSLENIGERQGLVSHSGKKIPWATCLSSQCCIYLSVHWMLAETIFQIDVPQGQGLLSSESDSTNEFPLTASLRPSSQTHKFHRWSVEMHAGRDRAFLLANLDQVTETCFTLGTGSWFWKKQTISRIPLGSYKTRQS